VNERSFASSACRSASQSWPGLRGGPPGVAGGVGDDVGRRQSGEQHARLLEGLADRGTHQRPRHRLRRLELVGPGRRGGSGPCDGAVEVARVDTATGKHAHPPGEGHRGLAAQQVELGARTLVGPRPHQDHGRGVPRLRGSTTSLGELARLLHQPCRQRHPHRLHLDEDLDLDRGVQRENQDADG
jgi:hypothetical protein